ncbi:NAD(P)/FAD-dependent oxidoreductase [Propioniciclava coleopterorum]|uniref:NAD(P)/FAD-dependent oxidoreductase n=1 Tax=Propioniciclava coleopterorum TaxID=2714937 RepID=A0A6G7Y7Y8_9ACTN|nr:NAD(P)-binding domain-containing protein [Propioniciclava coleopterorum]QIK72932.1 NAD(P)/FAD-dependent oxidoreductase [Propioniciclava coleopterorum]
MDTPRADETLAAVVIGAGQAGLSASHHLARGGLLPWRDFVTLDANDGPGGAWRHRWDSLTLGRAHGVHDLPGLPLGTPDPNEPASRVVARYYGDYERAFDLPVLRPAKVTGVESRADGPLEVAAGARRWRTRTLINATGTWDRPFWPPYPGRASFAGRQLHTRDFTAASEFAGLRVVVVGAGASAVQFLLQLDAAGASTTWVTRRPPEWVERPFDENWGRAVEERVRDRTERGLPPESVVAATGLALTPEYRDGIARGVLVSAGPMTAVTPGGVRLADGREVAADAILWATGFRHALDHLAGLGLREPGGGVRTVGVAAARDPRVFLVGYGASASTLGATRAGRAAARGVLAALRRG